MGIATGVPTGGAIHRWSNPQAKPSTDGVSHRRRHPQANPYTGRAIHRRALRRSHVRSNHSQAVK